MNKALLLPLLAAALALPLRAAPPTQASVDKLIALEKMTDAHASILSQIDKAADARLTAALRGQPATAADKEVFTSLHKDIAAAVDASLSEAALKADYEKIFAEVYTQEEVDGFIAFFSTKIGQEFAEKQPQVLQQSNLQFQHQMMPMIQRIQLATQADMQKLLAAHQPPPPPAPAPSAPSAPAQPMPKP